MVPAGVLMVRTSLKPGSSSGVGSGNELLIGQRDQSKAPAGSGGGSGGVDGGEEVLVEAMD
jgi:hypothetical protein